MLSVYIVEHDEERLRGVANIIQDTITMTRTCDAIQECTSLDYESGIYGIIDADVLTMELASTTFNYWELLDECLGINSYITTFNYKMLTCDIYFQISKNSASAYFL